MSKLGRIQSVLRRSTKQEDLSPGARVLKSKGKQFNGLVLPPPAEEQGMLSAYMDKYKKVLYIVGHGTTNEYFDLNLAVLQVYKILEAEGMLMKEANALGPLESWQEKILLVYGGDPNGEHHDIGKLLALVAQMLKGVDILAVQCDKYKDYALEGGPSYYHVNSILFYPTEYKEVAEETEKKPILYGGYTEKEGKRIPHGTTAIMADFADKWHGMIVIGGGDIAKEELEFFHKQTPESGSSSKTVICVKAEAKNIPRRGGKAAKVSDEQKYGSAWCKFEEIRDELKATAEDIVIEGSEKLTWYKLN